MNKTINIDALLPSYSLLRDYLFLKNKGVKRTEGKWDRVVDEEIDHPAYVVCCDSLVDKLCIKYNHGQKVAVEIYLRPGISPFEIECPDEFFGLPLNVYSNQDWDRKVYTGGF
jgi:hypothetical protein